MTLNVLMADLLFLSIKGEAIGTLPCRGSSNDVKQICSFRENSDSLIIKVHFKIVIHKPDSKE